MIARPPPKRFYSDLYFGYNSQNTHKIRAGPTEGEEEGIGVISLE